MAPITQGQRPAEHPPMSLLAILTTCDESLEDALLAARRSLLTLRGEPIEPDLRRIAKGGPAMLRVTLRNDLRAARFAAWYAAKGFDVERMVELAERYRRIAWYTWRVYRAAMREEQAAAAVAAIQLASKGRVA